MGKLITSTIPTTLSYCV